MVVVLGYDFGLGFIWVSALELIVAAMHVAPAGTLLMYSVHLSASGFHIWKPPGREFECPLSVIHSRLVLLQPPLL